MFSGCNGEYRLKVGGRLAKAKAEGYCNNTDIMRAEWTRVKAMVLGISDYYLICFEGRTGNLFADRLDLGCVSKRRLKNDYKDFDIKD